jgi:hypothetical protein
MPAFPRPSPENSYLSPHVALLRRCLREHTGRDLVETDLAGAEAAERIFHAPFALLSHNAEPDPIFTYGNLRALTVFELSWDELTTMPSRFTAEAPDREQRARLLAEVAANGFIENYSGVRISRTGKRFWIDRATVWNLSDESGRYCGQAAMFSEWGPLQPD